MSIRPPVPAAPPPVSQPAPSFNLQDIIRAMLAVSDKVSDLIFSPGRAPQVEVIGKLSRVAIPGLELLLPTHTAAIAKLLIANSESAIASLEKSGSADVSFSIPGLSRFRVNIFKQRGTIAIVMRVIPNHIPTLADLNLPAHVAEIADLRNGIVLLTGPTGSGKSSTLAAVIDLINQKHAYHIVTIEDPIEFLHPHKNSTIHQRELHTDTDTFGNALRAALRQAPKVILVGEMRDIETIEVALEAAETGHLVFSTLHTIDAAKTVERLIGVFPKSEEHIVRKRLSGSFRWIMSQRLIPRADGEGRMLAIEILRSTMRTREYIEKGESDGKSLLDAMKQGAIDGMQDFDTVIEQLVRDGIVTVEDGLNNSSNRGNLQLHLSEISTSTETPEVPRPDPPAGSNASPRESKSAPPAPAPAPQRPIAPREESAGGDSLLNVIER
jgi:twitching motility protein PilT